MRAIMVDYFVQGLDVKTNLHTRIRSVSYTHLDVYKRQSEEDGLDVDILKKYRQWKQKLEIANDSNAPTPVKSIRNSQIVLTSTTLFKY